MAYDKLFTYGPDNVDSLLATTLSRYVEDGNVIDNIFTATPTLNEMFQRADFQTGGASVIGSVMSEKNSTGAFYSGYDEIDTTAQEGITSSQAKWKELAASVSISNTEKRQNMGESRIVNLLDMKVKQAELTLKDNLSAALFSADTLTKAPESLNVMIDATSTIQDINSTSNSWWQAYVDSAIGAFATGGLSAMRTAWTTLEQRNPAGNPDIIVTTSDIFNAYEGALTPQTRYGSGVVANGGFAGLLFKTAKVLHDNQCTSGAMYMWNHDDLYFVIHGDTMSRTGKMDLSPFVRPVQQNAFSALMSAMLQVYTRARRKTGKLTGITT